MFSEHPYNVCKMIKWNAFLIVMHNQDKMLKFLNVQRMNFYTFRRCQLRCMKIVRKIKHQIKSGGRLPPKNRLILCLLLLILIIQIYIYIYIHNIKISCDQQLLEMTGRLPQSAIVEYYSGSMCSTDISAEMRSKLTSLSIQYMDHKRGSLTSEACGNMGRDVFAV